MYTEEIFPLLRPEPGFSSPGYIQSFHRPNQSCLILRGACASFKGEFKKAINLVMSTHVWNRGTKQGRSCVRLGPSVKEQHLSLVHSWTGEDIPEITGWGQQLRGATKEEDGRRAGQQVRCWKPTSFAELSQNTNRLKKKEREKKNLGFQQALKFLSKSFVEKLCKIINKRTENGHKDDCVLKCVEITYGENDGFLQKRGDFCVKPPL